MPLELVVESKREKVDFGELRVVFKFLEGPNRQKECVDLDRRSLFTPAIAIKDAFELTERGLAQ